MDATLAQNKIKQALKQVLKKRGHTYRDVAKVWNCSVPTVKRQLGNEELPVSRLLILLDWLDLSLGELQKLSEADTLMNPRFTAKQIDFLSKNLREFAFLNKLYEGLTPQQIAKRHKLEPAAVERILIQLEKHDLIRVGAGRKVKPFYSRQPGLEGALASALLRRQVDRMAHYSKIRIAEAIALKERGEKLLAPGAYNWSVAEVSEKSYREFHQKLVKTFEDFEAQSKIDRDTLAESEIKHAVVSFSTQLEESNSPSLKIVTETFDDYLNAGDV